jgi:hypothetical protein
VGFPGDSISKQAKEVRMTMAIGASASAVLDLPEQEWVDLLEAPASFPLAAREDDDEDDDDFDDDFEGDEDEYEEEDEFEDDDEDFLDEDEDEEDLDEDLDDEDEDF